MADYKQGYVTLPLDVYDELLSQLIAANKLAADMISVNESYSKDGLVVKFDVEKIKAIATVKIMANPKWSHYVITEDPYVWDMNIASLPKPEPEEEQLAAEPTIE